MHVSVLALVLGYISLALAQTQLLPTCAQSCVGTDFGGCSAVDVKCICSNKKLLTGLSCCVSTGCNAKDQQTVIDFAQNLCRPQGVTDLPTTATCVSSVTSTATATKSTATKSASATATVSSGVSSASASASSATGSAVSSATSAASSRASSAASAAASPTAGAGVCQGNTVGMGFGLILAGLLGVL